MAFPFNPGTVFRALVPAATDDKCLALNRAVLQIPLRLSQLFNWMFTGEAISNEFRAQVWPAGSIIQSAALVAPDGNWLECNGAEVNRVTYADLYAAIGDTYGDGDGATTFNLPDLRGRAIIGAGQLDTAGVAGATYAQGEQIGKESVELEMIHLPEEPAPLGDKTQTLVIKRVSGAIGVQVDISGAATPDFYSRSNGQADHADNVLGDLGDGEAHENRSPSLVLRVYIAY